MTNNSNKLGDRRTATNDRLLNRIQEYNDRASGNQTFKKNNQEQVFTVLDYLGIN